MFALPLCRDLQPGEQWNGRESFRGSGEMRRMRPRHKEAVTKIKEGNKTNWFWALGISKKNPIRDTQAN